MKKATLLAELTADQRAAILARVEVLRAGHAKHECASTWERGNTILNQSQSIAFAHDRPRPLRLGLENLAALCLCWLEELT